MRNTQTFIAAAALLCLPSSPLLAADHDDAVEAAPDPWTGFRAMGTEPFWSLTISEERLSFEHSGVFSAEAARPDALFSPDGAAFVSRSENPGNRDFIVVIEERLCSDGMSDRPYPQDVRVFVDGRYFYGCGGDPQDVLSGADWRVTELAGEAVPETAGINFRFDGMGGFFGTGGCNRFRSDYVLDEGLQLGAIAATRRACVDPEANRRENALFTALGRVITLGVSEDGTLTLFAEDGPVLRATR